MTKPKKPIQMAVIGAAHGIKGELRVKTFTADPLALGDYGPLYTKDGRAFEIMDVRPQGSVVVVRLKGVNDRNAAEALNGTELFIDRSAMPETLEDNEFYQTDLVGLEVKDDTGAMIGTVSAVQNFGGGDILEIALGSRQTVLIPFTRAAVPQIAISAGFIRIDPVAAGLVDDDKDDGERDFGDGSDREPGFAAKRRPRGPKDVGGNR
jgi:16S rRNA processing protein RimM